MPHWYSEQYLRFVDERTLPCRELAARVTVDNPRRVIDLGCGPGNSTQVLAQRWPDADLTGFDSSSDMLFTARRNAPSIHWQLGDIATWSAGPEPYDVVFSNAALQWVPDHGRLFPQLLAQVAPEGTLAVQVPCQLDAPAHAIARVLVRSSTWQNLFPSGSVREWHVHEISFYYDILARKCSSIELWKTEYQHILPGAEAIVEWYMGTGLRPYLELLKLPEDRMRFLSDYLTEIRQAYPARTNGQVLFPFQRMFIVAEPG